MRIEKNGGAAPGTRLRGRLNWLILKTLALDVGTPIVLGELVQLLYVTCSRSPMQALYRMRRPSFVTTYLYRLADRGYLRLEGLRRERQATLTPKGRRALLALERLVERQGEPRLRKAAESLAGRLAAFRARRLARLSPSALMRRMERERIALLRRLPGPPRATAFISYDLPRAEERRRRLVIAVLKGHGFKRLHDSLYTGASDRLRSALETLETAGVMRFLRWGTLSVFSP